MENVSVALEVPLSVCQSLMFGYSWHRSHDLPSVLFIVVQAINHLIILHSLHTA